MSTAAGGCRLLQAGDACFYWREMNFNPPIGSPVRADIAAAMP